MSFFENFFRGLVHVGSSLHSYFLLAVRLFWGYLFFQTGKGKLLNIDDVAQFFASLNIPWPKLNAYLSGTTECIGGLCLIFGLASRLVSLPLMFLLATAYATAHKDALQTFFENQTPLLTAAPATFFMAALIIFVFGPGRFSLDRLIENHYSHKTKK